MRILSDGRLASALVVGVAALLSSCASKGFVRDTVGPVDARLEEMETRTEENAAAVAKLDSDLARVDEVAQSAEDRGLDVEKAAAVADEKTIEAGRQADGARELAEKGLGRIDGVEHVLRDLDNYRRLGKQSVLFAFGSSQLSDNAGTELDGLIRKVEGHDRYAIEVVGFTDSTGPAELNLELSQRRADAVVRHLTLKHNIPLFRIFNVGLGKQVPVSDNKTRQGRRENRRVEVSVYVAGAAVPAETAGSSAAR